MKINGMAPLVVGDPMDLNSEWSRKCKRDFFVTCEKAKALGFHAVSTDIWWGLIEKADGQFDWRYPRMLLSTIKQAGLKWAPIISLHQCGGNIGDGTNHVPLPGHIWSKHAASVASGNPNALKYVSEQGNASNEYISCWATDLVLPDYKRVFSEFQKEFAREKEHIEEINISLGPAGELRFPSYNSHDLNTDFPTRGALQCYSELACDSWRSWLIAKYGSEEAVRRAWTSGVELDDPLDVASCVRYAWARLHQLIPPKDVDNLFKYELHTKSQLGRDLFDWQSDSLLWHGGKVMTAAIEEFGHEGAPFHGIAVAAKVSGVHWCMGHWQGGKIVWDGRLAELAAGMLRTSEFADWHCDETAHGCRRIIALFKQLQSVHPTTPVVVHFTCLEKMDGEDDNRNAQSLAHSLVEWMGAEARRQGVTIKGENALAESLSGEMAWRMIRSALKLADEEGDYDGLTLLRLSDIVDNDVALRGLASIISAIKPPGNAMADATLGTLGLATAA